MNRALIVAAALTVILSHQAMAQDDRRTEQVQLATGAPRAVIHDRITGYEVVRYVIGAEAGQRMTAALKTDHTSTYFNVVQPSLPDGPALAVSEQAATNPMIPEINRFDAVLPESGDYAIEVYMYRSAARRGESADFSLEVGILAPSGDYADGLAGGPDYWSVNVDTALNLRSAPSTAAPVVARLPKGMILQNRGCRRAESRIWCQVASGETTGWAAGAYLVESAPPAGDVAYGQGDASDDRGFNARGTLSCASAVGMPLSDCAFGVIRRGGGDATIVVSLPDGGERYIYFEGDRSSSDGGPAVWERAGDLNMIFVGDHERYEIPDAVRFGG